jgi:hypothetical protein
LGNGEAIESGQKGDLFKGSKYSESDANYFGRINPKLSQEVKQIANCVLSFAFPSPPNLLNIHHSSCPGWESPIFKKDCFTFMVVLRNTAYRL